MSEIGCGIAQQLFMLLAAMDWVHVQVSPVGFVVDKVVLGQAFF
jgi:hypothetical protein